LNCLCFPFELETEYGANKKLACDAEIEEHLETHDNSICIEFRGNSVDVDGNIAGVEVSINNNKFHPAKIISDLYSSNIDWKIQFLISKEQFNESDNNSFEVKIRATDDSLNQENPEFSKFISHRFEHLFSCEEKLNERPIPKFED
jgi:hypothetical protein